MRQSIVLKLFIIVGVMTAIGGAVVWSFAQSTEVRGSTETPAVSEAAQEMDAADTLSEEDPGAYLASLREDDYTTYSHPVYGFSFDYPREFALFSTETLYLDETFVRHPRLPLGINVYVRPIEGNEESEERMAFVTSLPADFDAEPPEGANGGAVALMALDDPYPGQYTRYFWFAHADHIYEIQLHAPDRELLELWARGFLYSSFSFPSQ